MQGPRRLLHEADEDSRRQVSCANCESSISGRKSGAAAVYILRQSPRTGSVVETLSRWRRTVSAR